MIKLCLFYMLIQPIFFLIETLFYRIYNFSGNIILAVISVSVAVVGLCLPFTVASEKIIKKNEKIKQQINSKLKSIKKNFKGDEKFLLIRELYKKHNYSPVSEIKSLLGILIQIPFFIAAFLFFSNLNVSSDIAEIERFIQPDGLISLNFIKINVLPLLMFTINIISVELYLKSINSNKRTLLYFAAITFFVILYNEPAILVLYWTINNLLYLIRNLVILLVKKNAEKTEKIEEEMNQPKEYTIIFLSVCLILTILLSYGLSPILMNYQKFFEDSKYLFTDFRIISFSLAFGTFFLYPVLFYFSLSSIGKKILTALSEIEILYLLVNYIIIFKKPCVQGAGFAEIPAEQINFFNVISIIALAIIIVAIIFIFKTGKQKCFLKLNLIFIITVLITGQRMLSQNVYFLDRDKEAKMEVLQDFCIGESTNKISLSKEKENVILFFFDSVSGYFLNELFLKDEPQYKEKFDGFVNYPDTLSPLAYTTLIQSALFAGYEYLPDKYYNALINEDFTNFTNESVLLLPTLFSQNNFRINFVNYYIQANNVNEEYGKIIKKAYDKNKIAYLVPEQNPVTVFFKTQLNDKRVVLIPPIEYFLSVIKFIMPPCITNIIISSETEYKYFNRTTPNYTNMLNYSYLYYLPNYINVNSSDKTYTFFYSNLTHDNFPTEITRNTGVDFSEKTLEWCETDCYYNSFANMMFLLDKFFQYLKENGIYDNTRIIISTDHGMRRYSPEFKYPWDTSAILLVKDFNKRGKMKSDNSYMLISDIPYLAVKGLIKNPKNPFTNKEIKQVKEQEKLKYPICGWYYDCYTNIHNKLDGKGQIPSQEGNKIKKYLLDNIDDIYYPDTGDVL